MLPGVHGIAESDTTWQLNNNENSLKWQGCFWNPRDCSAVRVLGSEAENYGDQLGSFRYTGDT